MHCSKCGKPLRGSDQRFCPECGTPVPLPSHPLALPISSSVLADPKVLVLIAGVVLTVIAFSTLHGFSADLALALIVIAGFTIFWRGIKLKLKLAGLAVGLLLVLASNGIEGWQEDKAQHKQEDQIKQQAAAEKEQKRLQEAAFTSLSPKEHLDKARALLKLGSPQTSIDEGMKHLRAVSSSAPEFLDAKRLRQQYEAAQKKHDDEQARVQAAEARKHAVEEAALNRTLRDSMAQTLENKLLDEGYNVDVKAIGNDHTTLHIKWILVSKVLAHQLSQEGSFFSNARAVGFKRVEITDGYDETWYWKL